jgi:hypothetical protein
LSIIKSSAGALDFQYVGGVSNLDEGFEIVVVMFHVVEVRMIPNAVSCGPISLVLIGRSASVSQPLVQFVCGSSLRCAVRRNHLQHFHRTLLYCLLCGPVRDVPRTTIIPQRRFQPFGLSR